MKPSRPDTLAILLVVLLAALFYRVAFQLYDGDFAACERDNEVRQEVDAREPPISATITVLIKTRLPGGAIYEAATDPAHDGDDALSAEAERLRRLRTEVKPVEQVNCQEEVEKPWPF